MKKLTAWLLILVGVLLLLPLLGLVSDESTAEMVTEWLIALSVLIIGFAKLKK
ncbi:MAG: hypothetical protein AABX10_04120 [Nanoarchaeota archaeon]